MPNPVIRQNQRSIRQHNRHQSNPRAIPASDYESDAANYLEARETPPTADPRLLQRTNTDLNLSVLRRYVPAIQSIISIAANAVVYTFIHDTQDWDKSGVEGTMFLCQMAAPPEAPGLERYCLIVLNRHGLNNVILDLVTVQDCELTDGLLILVVGDEHERRNGDEEARKNVMGVWMHASQADEESRQANMLLIQNAWKHVRSAWEAVATEGEAAASFVPEESVGAAAQAMGRRISISEFFGR